MKILLIVFTLVLSMVANAEVLADNTFAKLQYQEIEILDIQAVTSKIKYVPASSTNVAYYEGFVVVTAIVEGNLCTTSSTTFGTLQMAEGKVVYTKLVSGAVWTSELKGCPQFSRPTKVSFPVSIGWLVENGTGVNQSIANFKLGILSQKTASIILKTRGSQIQVFIRK